MRTSNRKPHRWSSRLATAAMVLAGAAMLMPSASSADEPASESATKSVKSVQPAQADDANKPSSARLRENNYYYGAFNKLDPFRSLVDGQFVRDSAMELVDLTGVELVGVINGDLDRFGLLEDEKGFTYILRVGDRVRGGTIVAIGDQTMTARITHFGQTSKFTLHMVQRQKGDKR